MFRGRCNFAIHYRPDSKTELSVQSLIGTGKAPLYTGATVYNLDEVVVQQHKLELKRGMIFLHGKIARISVCPEDQDGSLKASNINMVVQN